MIDWLRHWHVAIAAGLALSMAAAYVELADPLRRWIQPQSNDLDQAIWEFNQHAGHCGPETVLVVGSSVAREGFDSRAMERALGRPVFNMALSNAQIADIQRELELCPGVGVVVIGVNGLNFDDRMKRDRTLPWNRSTGPSLITRRAEISSLLEHRVRRFARFVAHRRRDDVAEGQARRQYRYSTRMRSDELANLKREMFVEYKDDGVDHTGSNFEALETIVRKVKANNTRLLVVWLPHLPEVTWAPFEASRLRAIERLRQLGVLFIDLSSMQLSAEDYYDFDHVLERGRSIVTAAVIEAVKNKAIK